MEVKAVAFGRRKPEPCRINAAEVPFSCVEGRCWPRAVLHLSLSVVTKVGGAGEQSHA